MRMDNHLIRSLDDLPTEARGGVLTIGNFDGVHLGHQRILQTARNLAAGHDCAVVAMTFEPPPDLVLRPDDKPARLTPMPQKNALLREAGADWVLVLDADRKLLGTPAEGFVDEIIVQRLSPSHIVEGENFFFGRGRQGNVTLLADMGRSRGFEVHVVEPCLLELDAQPVRVSSTLVRGLVRDGRMPEATRALGRPFALHGRVVWGAGRGRSFKYPTANLGDTSQIHPADGVYACFSELGGQRRPAAVSVGASPTFGGDPATVEAFILDAEGDFYEQEMSLQFLQRLREQRRFEDPQALRAQIARDVERVREICEGFHA
jgi:riboflavin kinase / FMN adenylyltransferase